MAVRLLKNWLRAPKRTTKTTTRMRSALGRAFEQLEDRLVPASFINYFSFPSGTWSYDHTTGEARLLTAARPVAMASSGYLLYAGYAGQGTFSYDYEAKSWTRLTTDVPIALANGGPTLYASYSFGTYFWNGSWHQISRLSANMLEAIGPYQCYGVFGSYLWSYSAFNNTWAYNPLPNGTSAVYSLGASGSTVVVGTNAGTFTSSYNTNGWVQVASTPATHIAMIGTSDFYFTCNNATFRCTNSRLVTYFGTQAVAVGAGEAGYDSPVFVGSWNTGSAGTFSWSNGHWTKLSSQVADMIV